MTYKKPIKASKYYPDFKQSIPDLGGKTFVITGTTTGTGKVAACALAEKNGRVIMLNRPSPRSEAIQVYMKTNFPAAMRFFCEARISNWTPFTRKG